MMMGDDDANADADGIGVGRYGGAQGRPPITTLDRTGIEPPLLSSFPRKREPTYLL